MFSQFFCCIFVIFFPHGHAWATFLVTSWMDLLKCIFLSSQLDCYQGSFSSWTATLHCTGVPSYLPLHKGTWARLKDPRIGKTKDSTNLFITIGFLHCCPTGWKIGWKRGQHWLAMWLQWRSRKHFRFPFRPLQHRRPSFCAIFGGLFPSLLVSIHAVQFHVLYIKGVT